MLKRTLYFIYSIPFNLENVQVYINYLNKNHHQKKLFSETKKIANKEYQIILSSITFEIEENKKFHIILKNDKNLYKSNNEYCFQKNNSLFIYDLKFEPDTKWYKKNPISIDINRSHFLDNYFIFKNKIPKEEFSEFKEVFIKESIRMFEKEFTLNILFIIDIIQECHDTDSLKGFIKKLLIIIKSNKSLESIENKLQLKQYKTIIDKISLKEFQNEFKEKYFNEEEKQKYFNGLHQIILFSYFKMDEFDKFK